MAAVVTNLAACVGGITWCVLDYRLEGKWSAVGFCSGVISGLVVSLLFPLPESQIHLTSSLLQAITPGSGFVPAWAAVVYGVCAGIGCNYATQLKFLFGVDDSLDIFAVHGVGGVLGNLLTGFFAADYIAALDGITVIPGGFLNRHWIQLAIQLADSVAGMAYSFVVTCFILLVMKMIGKVIPVLRLRVSTEEEERGIDDVGACSRPSHHSSLSFPVKNHHR